MQALNKLVAIGSTVSLAVTLIAAGFAAVAVPDWATVALSRAFSGCDQPLTPVYARRAHVYGCRRQALHVRLEQRR